LHPEVKDGIDCSKLGLSGLHLLSEGAYVPIGSDGGEQKLILFKLLKHLIDLVTTEFTKDIFTLVGLELKLDIVPVCTELTESLLDSNLLVSGVTYIFDLFLVGKNLSLKKMVHHEGLFLGVRNIISGDIDNGLPMSFLDRWLFELQDNWEHLFVVLDLLLELGVSLPSFEILWKGHTLLFELFNVVHPVGDHVDVDLRPEHVSPVVEGVQDF